jgi:Xaa-Pro aminopeptidase
VAAAIGAQRYRERRGAAQAGVAESGGAAMLVGVGPDLEWLTGYAAHGNERLNLLVIPAHGPITYISPRLELAAARQAPGLADGTVTIVAWDETDDPYALVPVPAAASASSLVLVSDGMRAAFVLGLQALLPDREWGLASRVLGRLRRAKDADELALMRAAAHAADRTIERIIDGHLVGRTEAEVASDVREILVDEGHDTAEFWIVASGPNSASPHHEPSDRVISPGEPLLLDIGGRLGGYCSDITRTVWVAGADPGGPDADFVEIYRAVADGQAAARDAIHPGLAFEALDAVARDVIAAAGFGERFIHRLDHGIGLEVHEEPYVVVGNTDRMASGDTFSCEPGVYIDGRFGVRIEDAMVCTRDGAESLNQASRELRIVSGR